MGLRGGGGGSGEGGGGGIERAEGAGRLSCMRSRGGWVGSGRGMGGKGRSRRSTRSAGRWHGGCGGRRWVTAHTRSRHESRGGGERGCAQKGRVVGKGGRAAESGHPEGGGGVRFEARGWDVRPAGRRWQGRRTSTSAEGVGSSEMQEEGVGVREARGEGAGESSVGSVRGGVGRVVQRDWEWEGGRGEGGGERSSSWVRGSVRGKGGGDGDRGGGRWWGGGGGLGGARRGSRPSGLMRYAGVALRAGACSWPSGRIGRWSSPFVGRHQLMAGSSTRTAWG